MPPDPRTMLITGARKGIGRRLAEHYLERGWRVFGISRGESDLEHDRYRHHAADVADEHCVREALRDLKREAGGLDALLNNAGIASMNHALLTPVNTVRRIMETNVVGTWLCCREAAKLMQARGTGRIVNFGSVAAPLQLEGESAYAASKAAVVCLTGVLARELAPCGITVNAVGPNPLRTDLVKGVPEDKLQGLVARQAIPRFGEIRDVVNVIDFFLAEESAFVTGQCLYLGGPCP